jgi:CRISPR-associated protein Csm1
MEDFLLATAADSEDQFTLRSHWLSLLSEILPRALLAELGLAKVLLGSSGGGQFLAVLPREVRDQASEFLAAAGKQIADLSSGLVSLIWATTENLGDWSTVRKRLQDEMESKRQAPAPGAGPELFQPLNAISQPLAEDYFGREMAGHLGDAAVVGWSPEDPGKVLAGTGKYTWPLNSGPDGIPLARHRAPADGSAGSASTQVFASRADGAATWGVLRGDVDSFGIRIRRAQSIEEHVQLSVMYKQFFAGELEVLCSMPEFWRKVSVLYSGGDDFAVYGSWDALIHLGRELQRLFHRFSEENLKDFPGPEGKTITMALALASEEENSLAGVFGEAGRQLEIAKSADKDCLAAFGRTLEWKQVADAAELKDTLTRMVSDLGGSTQFLQELGGFFRDTSAVAGFQTVRRGKGSHFERPWRVYRRLNRVLASGRDRDFQKLRSTLVNELIAKGSQVKLRPAGRVALEWAKLSTGESIHG